jgi:hypothetical protein
MNLLNVKYSLYHEIKTCILPAFGYVDTIQGEELSPVDSAVNAYSFSRKEIAYADPSGHIFPSGVSIYDEGRRLEFSEYSVNYLTSTVSMTATPSGVVTSDYVSYQVKVIDAYPDDEEFEHIDLPMISMDITENNPSSFAVGSSASCWNIPYFIDIFAINDPMRFRIMESLQRALRTSVPLLDFTDNEPLNYDGTINLNFDRDAHFLEFMKVPVKPKGMLVNTGSTDPKQKYRATIDGMVMNIF